MDFGKILNWKLAAGSHPFPGPNGGTCINEAAIVAAGFEYRSISASSQMPECFSRKICTFAMGLNDLFNDAHRQRLMPFVMRLAGTADSPEVEKERVHIKTNMLADGLVGVIASINDPDLRTKMFDIYLSSAAAAIGPAWDTYIKMYTEAQIGIWNEIAEQMKLGGSFAWSITQRNYIPINFQSQSENVIILEQLVELGVRTLEAMLAIGNKTEEIEVTMVKERMEKVRAKVEAVS